MGTGPVCVCFCVVLFLTLSVNTAEIPDSFEINEILEEAFACRKNNPALSVSVVKDGKIVFAEGYGVLALDDKRPVTNTTLFGIASLTKGFTSALLAKLTDASKEYSLNTRIAEFYGNHNVFDGYLRSKFATIRDLLSHRMGIPMHNFIQFDSKLTRKNLIRRIKELKPRGRFRDSFYYSNIMYGQAARLAEKIGRKKYEELIRDELFSKIGMTESDFFTTANESTIELANGYLNVYDELHKVPFQLSKRWSGLCGANCILSSAIDMAKWMLFHLNHGKNQNGRRVMSHDALEDTHKPENILAKSSLSKYFSKPGVPETFSQTGYALGWRTGHYRGYDMLTHTGSSWGYKNMITMFPEMNVGIYTAMTGDDEDFMFRYSVHQYLADKYMGLTPWLNSSLICSYPEPWLAAKPKRSKPTIKKDLPSKRNLDDYLGVYTNPAYGQIEIFILDEENSTNKLIAEYGYVDLIMYPKSRPDEFFFETDGIAQKLINFGTVQFKAVNGVIDKMRIPSFEPKDPPVFKRVNKPNAKVPIPDTTQSFDQPVIDSTPASGQDNVQTDIAAEKESNTRNVDTESMTALDDINTPTEATKETVEVAPEAKAVNPTKKSKTGRTKSGNSTKTVSEASKTDKNKVSSRNKSQLKTKQAKATRTRPESNTEATTKEVASKPASKSSFIKPKSTENEPLPNVDLLKPKTKDNTPAQTNDAVKSKTDAPVPIQKTDSLATDSTQNEPIIEVTEPVPITETVTQKSAIKSKSKKSFVKPKSQDADARPIF